MTNNCYEEILQNIDKYKLIGKGGSRSVYDIGNGLVLKVAHEGIMFEAACEVNQREYYLYNNVDEKDYFCPSYWVSEDGRYQVMANATYLEDPVAYMSKERFIETLIEFGADEDVQFENNWVNNYLIDYNMIYEESWYE